MICLSILQTVFIAMLQLEIHVLITFLVPAFFKREDLSHFLGPP